MGRWFRKGEGEGKGERKGVTEGPGAKPGVCRGFGLQGVFVWVSTVSVMFQRVFGRAGPEFLVFFFFWGGSLSIWSQHSNGSMTGAGASAGAIGRVASLGSIHRGESIPGGGHGTWDVETDGSF